MTAPNTPPEWWPRCPAGCGRLLVRRQAPLVRTEADVEGVQMVLCSACWALTPKVAGDRVHAAWRRYRTDPSEANWNGYRHAYDAAIAEARARLDAHRPVETTEPVGGLL